MKYLILIPVLIFSGNKQAFSQIPDSLAIHLAHHIAQKMKDTLNLNNQQKDSIYNINMGIHNQKRIIRQQYNNPDSLRFHLQHVENSRDSLYRNVLNEQKYQLYIQKKRNLVNSN